MKIAICDDEPIFIEQISSRLCREAEKHEEPCEFLTCRTGDELLKRCRNEKIDAVFLDIAMPGIDGFQTAERLREIRKSMILVFVSGKESMVFSSYEYAPFWFVPKSQLRLLDIVMEKIIQKYTAEKKSNTNILISLENKVLEISLKDTLYFKTDEHYIRMITAGGGGSPLYRHKLNDVENQLKALGFVRAHSRYLVNCRAIRVIENASCKLHDGSEIPISRARMCEVKEAFQNYLRSIR